MKILVIQARMGSTRFPGKTLAPLHGRPMIEWVIDAAKQVGPHTVVVTTDQLEDDVIAGCAESLSVDVYRDGLKPLMLYDWYLAVGRAYAADQIIRVCGDCPFLDVEFGQKVYYKGRSADYATQWVGGVPAVLTEYGIHCESMSMRALERTAPIRHRYMQHVTTAFYLRSGLYNISYAQAPRQLVEHPFRATVDTPEDLARLNERIRRYGRMPSGWEEVQECLCT